MSPLVSAVIPTHHRPGLVLRAVRSALSQTYSNLEVIVVVDGPEPETIKMLESLQEPRLRVIAVERNVGGSGARNIGVEAAHGEWIAFLDDDDEWLPEKTQKQVAFLEHADLRTNFVVGRCRDADTAFEKVWPREFPHVGENWSEYLSCRGGSPGSNTFLVKRKLMIEVPFQCWLSSNEDLDWLLRADAAHKLFTGWLDDTLAITHHDCPQATRTSGKADWDQFYQWILQSRSLMTPRAFSYCLVSHGLPRIRRGRKSPYLAFEDFLRLTCASVFLGKVDLRLCAYFPLFFLLSSDTRHKLRLLYEHTRQEIAARMPGLNRC